MPFSNPAEREQEIFGPDTVAVLAAALEDAVRQLRLVDRNDTAVTKVAKTIIELARRGERDPIRLRDQAIQSFRQFSGAVSARKPFAAASAATRAGRKFAREIGMSIRESDKSLH
jgi:hypothetical protein